MVASLPNPPFLDPKEAFASVFHPKFSPLENVLSGKYILACGNSLVSTFYKHLLHSLLPHYLTNTYII